MEKVKQMISKLGKKFYLILAAVILVVAVIIGVIVMALGGDSEGGGGDNKPGGDSGDNTTYTVSVKTQGGMALEGLDVYVYGDEKMSDLKQFAATNEEGIVTFSLPERDDYVIAVTGAAKGYNVEESYSFSGDTAIITLSSSLITDEDISSATLKPGDVMYDFTVTNTNDEKVTLSEMLKEKDVVLLNFWYTTCTWCLKEFPFMSETYEKYKDNVGIIALNSYAQDTLDGIKQFQAQQKLPFEVAQCPPSWANTFGVQGYPTTVVIDRYGVICAVESGALTSPRPFISLFDHFTGDDYEQIVSTEGVAPFIKEIKPTYTMPSVEEIAAVLNKGDINVTYHAEEREEFKDTIWPFIIGEKDGEKFIYPSNTGIEDSSAMIYANVELKKGQALAFDYFSSSEAGSDMMYVIVNDDDIYTISGEADKWQTCYPWVATEDGTYELILAYIKDSGDNVGDDTVRVKNLRVVDEKDIDAPAQIPRYAAISEDGFDFDYVDIVYNEKDGYYHVGSADGPLLLADLMGYTLFSEEKAIIEMVNDPENPVIIDGKDLYNELGLVKYCSYASNATINGLCTVNKELAELLQKLAAVRGFDKEDENEWLKICKYFQIYGPGAKQLEDPIKGLNFDSAFTAKEGKNVSTNYFTYNRAIMPRGYMAEFVPSKSGAYLITSHHNADDGDVEGWVFDDKKEALVTFEQLDRVFEVEGEITMVMYMEAGKSYYIDICYWDIYGVGTIKYDIEYLGATYSLFTQASPGYFTYDEGATGNEMYYTIAGGIKPILGTDGYYYEDLGKDANGKQKYGSKIYADFTGITGIFSQPITGNNGYTGMIDLGGFDFTKSETDMEVLRLLRECDNDVEKVKEKLIAQWGEAGVGQGGIGLEAYKVEEVAAGIYHGDGEDYTAKIKEYLSKIENSPAERKGCVAVDKELAEILQKLMDKYTFKGVDHSWTKVCYYYDFIGPEN